MNEVFIIGKIISDVEYKFIVDSKVYFSKVKFNIENNKQIFRVKGYNDIADYCYRKLNTEDIVLINGKIESDMEIEILDLELSFSESTIKRR